MCKYLCLKEETKTTNDDAVVNGMVEGEEQSTGAKAHHVSTNLALTH